MSYTSRRGGNQAGAKTSGLLALLIGSVSTVNADPLGPVVEHREGTVEK